MKNNNIKAELIRSGIKMSEAAEQLGISKQHFANKVAGRYKFNQDEIDKLIELTGKTYKELFK